MKLVKLEETQKFKNGEYCEVLEYPMNDKDINCATGIITGRYPEIGSVVNEKCKELIYIIEGSGSLNKKDEKVEFKAGDVILIEAGEIYYWKGNCKIVMPCTPAWYPEQHKLLNE
jgi:mannose-6-phosphate isomerase-like protein (cupin superfamily)